MLSPDTVLQSRYRIVRKFGEGGMGSVYLAIDERFDNEVAIKESHFTDDASRRQFEREARLLNKLRHPAMTKVIDHFMEGDGQFLVMEFIGGDDLWEMLQKRGKAFTPNKVLEWADQLLDALCYLHNQDPPIIHRDIKPQNLKLSDSGQIILLDFGLAKGTLGQSASIMTSRSVYGYTPVYAPLEQITAGGTDPRSDIYSLGATLYHLLTGIIPVDAPTRFNAIEEGRSDPLRPVHEVNPEVSREISEVIKRAMTVSRKDRIATAEAMRDALRSANQVQHIEHNELKETVLPQTIINPAPTELAQEQEAKPASLSKREESNRTVPSATIASPTVASLEKPTPSPSSENGLLPNLPSPFPLSDQPQPTSRRKLWVLGSVVVLFIAIAASVIAYRTLSAKGTKQSKSLEQYARTEDALLLKGKYNEGEASFRQAIEAEPENPEWHNGLGYALKLQGKDAEAEASGREAERLSREKLKSEPNNARWHSTLARALYVQQKYTEAEEEYRQALKLEPNNAEWHAWLGNTLAAQGKKDLDEAEQREALRLVPTSAKYRAFLASNLMSSRENKIDEAESLLRDAIRIEPDNALIHKQLSQLLIRQRKYSEAEAEAREAIKLSPNLPEAHYRLAVALNIQSKNAEAETVLRTAIRLKSNNSSYHSQLGMALEFQKKYAEAETAYKEAIRLWYDNSQYHTYLANVLDAQGKRSEASEERKKAASMKASEEGN